MSVSPFNAMHASVDPRGILIRDFLAAAGEEHGRAAMALAHDRVRIVTDVVASAVVEIIEAEGLRMAVVYAEAGCSRRQVRAFLRAYYRGVSAANAEAIALCAADHLGSA